MWFSLALFPTANGAHAGAKKFGKLRLAESQMNPNFTDLCRLHLDRPKGHFRHPCFRFLSRAVFLGFIESSHHFLEKIIIHLASPSIREFELRGSSSVP